MQQNKLEQQDLPRIGSIAQWLWALFSLTGLLLFGSGLLQAQRMLSCASWPTAPGVIVKSELKRGYMREGSLKYNFHIVYQYTVNGADFQNDRISFTGQGTDGRTVTETLRTYSKGRTMVVYHNPTNPALSVLETKAHWAGFKRLILGLVIVLLAVTGFWRRWPMQSDYLFREHDPDAPMKVKEMLLGSLGLLVCLGIGWLWWELIKMYAGR